MSGVQTTLKSSIFSKAIEAPSAISATPRVMTAEFVVSATVNPAVRRRITPRSDLSGCGQPQGVFLPRSSFDRRNMQWSSAGELMREHLLFRLLFRFLRAAISVIIDSVHLF